MSYEYFFVAIQNEIWRFNHRIAAGAKPTVYRYGKTYEIYFASYESGRIWLECYELLWCGPSVRDYAPFLTDETLICEYDEWSVLMRLLGLARHDFLAKREHEKVSVSSLVR